MAKGFDYSKIPWTPILYVGGGILAYFYIVSPVLETVGLKKSGDAREVDKVEDKAPGFNPNFWVLMGNKHKLVKEYVRAKSGKVTLRGLRPTAKVSPFNQSDLFDTVKMIYNSMDGAGTDEDMLRAAFKKVRNQFQMSQVTWGFNTMYNADLFNFLRGDLGNDSDDMVWVTNYVKNLPLLK